MSTKKEPKEININAVLSPGSKLNERGHEVLDSTPMALPVGARRPESIQSQIRRMIRSEHLAQAAAASGRETFEEADDFNVGDDYDPKSPYEMDFDPDLPPPSQPVPPTMEEMTAVVPAGDKPAKKLKKSGKKTSKKEVTDEAE